LVVVRGRGSLERVGFDFEEFIVVDETRQYILKRRYV
jgi:hypothetical protein